MAVAGLENCDLRDGIKCKNALFDAIVEKCISSSRIGTRTKGIELVILFVELEGKADAVVDALGPYFDNKSPKVVAGCVESLRQVLKGFGSQVVDIKQLLRLVPKLFSHSDKTVRQEAYDLAVEIHRWNDKCISSIHGQLKPVQVKEIQTLVENAMVHDKPEPTRFPRNKKKVQQQEQSQNVPVESIMKEPECKVTKSPSQLQLPVDDFDNCIPVDLLGQLDGNFYEQLDSQKWKDKKEALDLLEGKLANTVRLEEANYGELVNNLAKKISDLNVLIAIGGAKCLERLFVTLRKSLLQYKGIVIPALLDRLKEKKQQVLETLRAALDSYFMYCKLSFSDAMHFASEFGMNHKNPLLKSESFAWIKRCLQYLKTLEQSPSKGEFNSLAESCIKNFEESAPEVRDSCYECIATLIDLVGEKPLLSYLDKLDKIKKAKIDEFIAKLHPQSSTQTNSIKIGPSEQISTRSNNADSLSEKAKANGTQRVETAKSTGTSSKKQDLPKNKQESQSTTALKYSSPQEVFIVLEQMFLIPEQLNDPNWKIRLEAVESLCDNFVKHSVDAEAAIVFLTNIKPTWKELNMQILQRMIETISHCAKSGISAQACSICICHLFDKIAEPKLKTSIAECLSVIFNKIGFVSMFSLVQQHIASHKNPKIIIESLRIFQSLLDSVSCENEFSIKPFVGFCRKCSSHSNAQIRTETIAYLCKLRQIYGKDILSLLDSFPSNFMTTLESEFKKQPIIPKPVCRSNSLVEQAVEMDVVDNSATQMEIDSVGSAEIDHSLLAQLDNPDWKVRKLALDSIQKVLTSNEVTVTIDLVNIFRNHLSDSNKSIVIQLIECIATLALVSKNSFDKHYKPLLPLLVKYFSDSKDQIRIATGKCFDAILQSFGIEAILSTFDSSLSANDNPLFRKEIIQWLVDKQKSISSKNLSLITPAINACLQDKNQEIKKLITSLLTLLIEQLTFEQVKTITNDYSEITNFLKSNNSKFSSGEVSSNSFVFLNFQAFSPDHPAHAGRVEKNTTKWNPETQCIDILREQLGPFFQPNFISRLFSTNCDYKQTVATLDMLEETILNPAFFSHLKCTCDLIFKVIALKLLDSNTYVIAKSLDICEKLILFIDSNDLKLSEYECNCYLPFIIHKLGECKENSRPKLHDIIKLSCRVFPASRIFSMLAGEGLKNKNAKSRNESLEAMLILMGRNEIPNLLSVPSKIVPLIAGAIGDRDANVRNTCLKVFSYIYANSTEGPSLISKYAYPVLGAKERDFLDERLKRTQSMIKEVKPERVSKVIEPSAPPTANATCQTFKLDLEEVEAQVNKQLGQQQQGTSSTSSFQSALGPPTVNVDFLLTNLISNDQVKCLDAVNSLYLSVVTYESKQFDSRFCELLCSSVLLVKMIMNQSVFEHPSSLSIKIQLLRKVMEIILKMVKVDCSEEKYPDFRVALYEVYSELTLRLVDGSLNSTDENGFVKLFNDTIVHLLEEAPKNATISILIQALRESCYNFSSSPSTEKLADLLMRCLWKVTKSFSKFNPQEIRPQELMQEIAQFYSELPSATWKERQSGNVPLGDLPHRTVKAILGELYKMFGENLFFFLKDPHYEYIRMTLVSIRERALSISTSSLSEMQIVDSSSPSDSAESSIALNQQLTKIFSKLTNKNYVNEGLQELHQFRQTHSINPAAERLFQEHLGKCSSIFQRHIRAQLDKISCKEQRPCNSPKRNHSSPLMLDPYQQKLDKFKEILGMSNSSTSSLTIVPPANTESPDLTQFESNPSSQNVLTVESIKERLSRLKAMNSSTDPIQ